MSAKRVIATALLGATVACSTLQPVRQPVAFIAENNPPMVFVTQANGKVLSIADPKVTGDTMRGMWQAETQNIQIALPLSQVHAVSTVRLNRALTIGLVAGAVAGAGLVTYALFGNSSGQQGNWYCDYNTAALDGNGAPRCGFVN